MSALQLMLCSQVTLEAQAHPVLPGGALLLVGTGGGAAAALEAAARAEPQVVGSHAAGAPVLSLGYSAAAGQVTNLPACDIHGHKKMAVL